MPIPIFANGKNPIIKEWTKYCREKPSRELIEQWEDNKAKTNIGLTCGPASGIVGVDIDTDNKEFMDLCPPSHVRRRGKKGEIRVFRWREGIKSQSFPNLDILSDGRQFLVPDSIHPETKEPYRWITDDTLENTTVDELPELDISFLEKIAPHTTSVKIEGNGRNNKLVDVVSAMRGRGEPELNIVKEVYNWDMMYHRPRLFTDEKEGFRGADEVQALNNAWQFVLRVTMSLVKGGFAMLDDMGKVIIINEDVALDVDSYKVKDYPEPTGLMKDVKNLILDLSERHMPVLATGGAVALMSAICSNRFRFDMCWPNTYVLNLAPTGSGKSFPQTIISKLLNEKLNSTLMGYGSYHSATAFCKNLVTKRERLDIIDEISSLFAQMNEGGPWQQIIVDEMCKVWSASSGLYSSGEYAKEDSAASCYNPCVSVLGSSTLDGLKGNISKMMTTKGLMPRFLIFADEKYGKPKESFLNEKLLDDVAMQLDKILKVQKPILECVQDLIKGPAYHPYNLTPTEPEAIKYFKSIRTEFFDRIETEPSQPLKDMLTRGKEQIMKLAILHCAGNFRDSINIQDLAWAKHTWEVCFHNSTPLIQETAVDSEWERDVVKMMELFKRNKNKVVTFKAINARIQSLPHERAKKIIDHLIAAEKISAAVSSHKKVKGWTLG